MPKILHMISQIPAQTGSGIFFENMIRQCAHANYTQGAIMGLPVHLAGYHLKDIPSSHISEVLFETDALPFKIPGMSDVMPYDSTIFSHMTSDQLEAYQLAFESTFTAAVLSFQPDLILSHHLWVATAVAANALDNLFNKSVPLNIPRPKCFAICHGTDLRQLQLSPQLTDYVTQGCRKVDGVFTLSNLQNHQIPDLYHMNPDKVHLVGGGYDATVFNRGDRTSENQPENGHKKTELVYAGKLAQSKGLFELIHCMEQLDSARFSLKIAGNGSGHEAEELFDAIKHSKADIQYVGQLPQNELASLFRRGDIFVLPSYYEGLSLVAIEALACGMQVVVNNLEGLHDWLGDTVNHSGRVHYVDMPKLLGPDLCSPDVEKAYVKDLTNAIETCADAMIHHTKDLVQETQNLDDFYKAIEEKSWTGVFARMERVFKTEASNRSNPVSV